MNASQGELPTVTRFEEPLVTPEQSARRSDIETRMLAGQVDHDGPSELNSIGNSGSIPALMVQLRAVAPQEGPVPGTYMAVCTHGHTMDALKAITHLGADWSHDDWIVWWEQPWWSMYSLDDPASSPQSN